MTVLLSLFAALAYGASDFVAGLFSRRTDPFVVALVTQAGGLLALLAALPVVAALGLGGRPSGPALGWGAAAGVGAAVGTLALYRGLGSGRMSVVAPVSGLGSAVLPAIVGVLAGEHLSRLTGAGVLVGVVAVGLVSSTPDGPADAARPSGLLDGVVAGVGFAELFIALDEAGGAAGIWPLIASSATGLVVIGLVVIGVVVLARRTRVELAGRVVLPVLGAGMLASGALVAFLAATSHGTLAVASVLTALYPGATVLLAVLVLREHTGRVQLVGLLLAAVAVVAVTLG